MSEREAEVEVVALVVSKGNIPDSMQYCESVHQAGEAHQEAVGVCPQNEFMISEPSDICNLNVPTQGESINNSYSSTSGENQNADGGMISNRSTSYMEKTTDHYGNEELSIYQDRNHHVQQENKQMNYEKNNCYTDQNPEEYSIYSNEHIHHGTDKNYLNQLENSYNSETIKTSSNIVEPSSQNKPHSNNIHIHSNGQSYIQMTNVPIETRESYQERKYEYFEVANNQSSITSDQHEIASHGVYAQPENGYDLQENGDSRIHNNPCHDEYYTYEPQNEEIYKNDNVSAVKNSEDYNYCSCQCNEGRLYDKEEATPAEHNNYNNQQNIENQNYTIDGRPNQETEEYKENLKRQYSLHEEINDYSYKERSCQKFVTSAVDLRILRQFRYPPSSDQQLSVQPYVAEDINPSEDSREDASSSESLVDYSTTPFSSNVIVPNHTSNEEAYNATSQPNTFHYSLCETKTDQNHEKCDVATNTDHLASVDKGSQTNLIESKDVAIQTDIENNKVILFSLFENIQAEIVKYSCTVCKRNYISKSSFDRHLKTHEKGTNNVQNDFKITARSKLKICKRLDRNTHLKTHKPIIIQIPRSVFQCDMCEMVFPNQMKKDNHSCVFDPFPLTKCPECNLKFYTTGGLNEHIGIVHKKKSSYYCIFCSKSFSAGYDFHLHLDGHLSSQ